MVRADNDAVIPRTTQIEEKTGGARCDDGSTVFDLYVWDAPRDLSAASIAANLAEWHDAGADPAASPFDPTTNVGWFARELIGDAPGLLVSTDARPRSGSILLASDDEPPARLVAINIPRSAPDLVRETLELVLGLAAKYDLLVYDAQNREIHQPLDEMARHASETFWPAGAIQAAVAGGIGFVVAVGAWLLGIPILSGLVALAGGFMAVMAVYSFVHEGRAALRRRRQG